MTPNHILPENLAQGAKSYFESASFDDRIRARILVQMVLDEEGERQRGEYGEAAGVAK